MDIGSDTTDEIDPKLNTMNLRVALFHFIKSFQKYAPMQQKFVVGIVQLKSDTPQYWPTRINSFLLEKMELGLRHWNFCVNWMIINSI